MTDIKKALHEIDKIVGERVRNLRIQHGMSQERLGEILNVTFQQIQKYEKGLNRISAGRLFYICKTFNTCPSVLLRDIDDTHVEVVPLQGKSCKTVLHLVQDISLLPEKVQKPMARLIRAILDTENDTTEYTAAASPGAA
jgi:transcriptional regulator with XRE-family HTH domain